MNAQQIQAVLGEFPGSRWSYHLVYRCNGCGRSGGLEYALDCGNFPAIDYCPQCCEKLSQIINPTLKANAMPNEANPTLEYVMFLYREAVRTYVEAWHGKNNRQPHTHQAEIAAITNLRDALAMLVKRANMNTEFMNSLNNLVESMVPSHAGHLIVAVDSVHLTAAKETLDKAKKLCA